MDRRCSSKTKAKSPCPEAHPWLSLPSSAGDGDSAAIGRRRHPEFEADCRELLGLGDPATVVAGGASPYVLGTAPCRRSRISWRSFAAWPAAPGASALSPTLVRKAPGDWQAPLHTQSGEPVWVAAPGPRLSRRVNDKLWFSERVTEVLGRQSPSPYLPFYGPEALARRIALLVRKHNPLHQGA